LVARYSGRLPLTPTQPHAVGKRCVNVRAWFDVPTCAPNTQATRRCNSVSAIATTRVRRCRCSASRSRAVRSRPQCSITLRWLSNRKDRTRGGSASEAAASCRNRRLVGKSGIIDERIEWQVRDAIRNSCPQIASPPWHELADRRFLFIALVRIESDSRWIQDRPTQCVDLNAGIPVQPRHRIQ
jgi:hypothetical protein